MTPTEANESANEKQSAVDSTKSQPVAEKIDQKGPEATEALKPASTPPKNGMAFILDIPLEITVELGRTRMVINDLLKLGQGSVIELSKLAGETLDILANQRLIARGEVVVVDEKYGIRLTEVISPIERVEKLR